MIKHLLVGWISICLQLHLYTAQSIDFNTTVSEPDDNESNQTGSPLVNTNALETTENVPHASITQNYRSDTHNPKDYVVDTNATSGPVSANATSTPYSCPSVLCAMECPGGYAKDMMGCDMCQCVPVQAGSMCSMIRCMEDTECVEEEGNVRCKAIPICPHRRAQILQKQQNQMRTWPMLLHGSPTIFGSNIVEDHTFVPVCEDDGSFVPRQCHENKTVASVWNGTDIECWCVDDRGVEIDGTRHLKDEDNDTACDRKRTQKLDIFFSMMHSYEQLEPELEQFELSLRLQLSQWTTTDMENIQMLTVRSHSFDKVVVEFSIYQHGDTDLATVSFHFLHIMKHRNLEMHYKGTTFTPVPESLRMTHHYKGEEPRVVVCYGPSMGRKKAVIHILAAMVCGAVVLVLGVFLIVMSVQMARKRRVVEESDKEAFFGRNLFYTNMPSLIPADEEKKEPIA